MRWGKRVRKRLRQYNCGFRACKGKPPAFTQFTFNVNKFVTKLYTFSSVDAPYQRGLNYRHYSTTLSFVVYMHMCGTNSVILSEGDCTKIYNFLGFRFNCLHSETDKTLTLLSIVAIKFSRGVSGKKMESLLARYPAVCYGFSVDHQFELITHR